MPTDHLGLATAALASGAVLVTCMTGEAVLGRDDGDVLLTVMDPVGDMVLPNGQLSDRPPSLDLVGFRILHEDGAVVAELELAAHASSPLQTVFDPVFSVMWRDTNSVKIQSVTVLPGANWITISTGQTEGEWISHGAASLDETRFTVQLPGLEAPQARVSCYFAQMDLGAFPDTTEWAQQFSDGAPERSHSPGDPVATPVEGLDEPLRDSVPGEATGSWACVDGPSS